MKLVLEQDSIIKDFFENTRMLGIMASLKNYSFCWYLNNYIGVNFKLNNDCEMHARRKNRNYFFNLYEWKEPGSFLTHYLYHNQNDGEYLISEYRNMDFLWLMKGDTVENEKIEWFKSAIKQINGVQLVAELSSNKIKDSEKARMII
ncbi:MAG: IPExxxVDY family protein [Chitinophagaceae bacterium]